MYLIQLASQRNKRCPRLAAPQKIAAVVSDGRSTATPLLNSSRTVADVHRGWSSALHFAWRVAVDAAAAISTEKAMLLAGDEDCHRR